MNANILHTACNREKKNAWMFLVGKREEKKRLLGEFVVDGKIILKWILKK
jgi:hypothetical protein